MDQIQNKFNIPPERRHGRKSIIVIIIVSAIAVLVLIYAVIKSRQDMTADKSKDVVSTVEGASTSTIPEPKTVAVTLTDTGYSPRTITINQGDTVIFTNDSSGKMWTASGPHPKHTGYPEFDEKSAANHGESYSFTFNKAGTWAYHNHLNEAQTGTVIVEPGEYWKE